MSAKSMLDAARKSLADGIAGRPNPITREYASRHGDEFLRASWCDMGVTFWARHSGNAAAVLLGGDRAYTVWHAQDFQKAGRWHVGTVAEISKAKPGDIVFFDWGGSDSIGNIDHVGVVEKNLGGGVLQTIEANTSDAVKRRIRYAADIAGYGRPGYPAGGTASGANWTEKIVNKLPELSKAKKSTGEHVETVQGLLKARSHPEVNITGIFDDRTDRAVRAVQEWGGVDVDGVVGQDTWSVLLRVH